MRKGELLNCVEFLLGLIANSSGNGITATVAYT